MKKIRILALHLAYGGVEKAIIGMANLFAEQYDVEIISVYQMPNSPAFPLDGRVKVRYLLSETPNREEWKRALKTKDLPRFMKESVKAVRVLRGKKRAVREAIASVHDGVLITTRHEDNLVLSALGDKKVLKIAQLHHDHRFEKKYITGFKKGYGNVDIFALLTPSLVEEVREMMDGNSHTRLVYIPNFLDSYPEQVTLRDREEVIFAAGRLDAVKGFDRLIRCFSEVSRKRPGSRLRIAGEGADRERLEALIKALGLEDRVTLLGRLDKDGVQREMLSASVYAMSSHSEGFPFVLIEAMSCGLPVVAFDVRVGPGFLIEDGKNGLLVPDGDGQGYAEALLTLLEDPHKRIDMGEAARERAQDFSKEKVKAMWLDLIGD